MTSAHHLRSSLTLAQQVLCRYLAGEEPRWFEDAESNLWPSVYTLWALPTPATLAISTVLKAGETVAQSLSWTHTVFHALQGAQPLFHALLASKHGLRRFSPRRETEKPGYGTRRWARTPGRARWSTAPRASRGGPLAGARLLFHLFTSAVLSHVRAAMSTA